MSNIDPEAYEHAFEEHPCSSVFLEKAFADRDEGGDGYISRLAQHRVAAEFGLDIGCAAALAYLAKNRAEAITEEIEWELELAPRGDWQ